MSEWESDVDRMFGFQPKTARSEVDYRELGRSPLSGTWRGWYLQPMISIARVAMTIRVDVREGQLFGDGEDKLDTFRFRGTLDVDRGDARLVKQYASGNRILYAGKMRDGIVRGIWTFPGSDRRGLFVLGHEDHVPPAKESVLGAVPALVALWLAPLRLPTILRSQELARRFHEDHPEVRAWLARGPF